MNNIEQFGTRNQKPETPQSLFAIRYSLSIVMLTDSEIRKKGLRALVKSLGDVNAEKFISLLMKEPFDYTAWQQSLWENRTIDQVSEKAMAYRHKNKSEK